MINFLIRDKYKIYIRIIVFTIILSFIFSGLIIPSFVYAQPLMGLPVPGNMVPLSPVFVPTIIRGLTVDNENPFHFNFIVDAGDNNLDGDAFKAESKKLIKYFLASLTLSEEDMWVNLSPYEENKIIPEHFGLTEMGRDLLAQDYLLKQITASLMFPESDLGKVFWERVYQKANELYGASEIPVNTFNKVWITPEKAVIYIHGDTAFVAESRLNVMLESDYLAVSKNSNNKELGTDKLKANSQNEKSESVKSINDITSQIVREVFIPELKKEVNEGENFALLRQIYNSMILAAWYKKSLKESIFSKVYVNRNKTIGVDVNDKHISEKIYRQYLEAFKKGVYSYTKDDYDPQTQEVITRKYFSGGVNATNLVSREVIETFSDTSLLSASSRAQMELAMQRPLKEVDTNISGLRQRGKSRGKLPASMLSALASRERGKGSSSSQKKSNLPSSNLLGAGLAGLLGLFSLAGSQAKAVTPESEEFYQILDGYHRLSATESARELNSGLDAIVKNFSAKNGGQIVPPSVSAPKLKSILGQIPPDQMTFDNISREVSRQFKTYYAIYKSGRYTQEQIGEISAFEQEVLRWLYKALDSNITYDQTGADANGPDMIDLHNAIVGNPRYKRHPRTMVCESASKIALMMLHELGFGEESKSVSIVGVKKNFTGNDMDLLGGHMAVLWRGVGNRNAGIFDLTQGLEGGLNINVSHRVITVPVEGKEPKEIDLTVSPLIANRVVGEVFGLRLEFESAWAQKEKLFERHLALIEVFNDRKITDQDALTRFTGIASSTDSLLGLDAAAYYPILRSELDRLAANVRGNIAVAQNNIAINEAVNDYNSKAGGSRQGTLPKSPSSPEAHSGAIQSVPDAIRALGFLNGRFNDTGGLVNSGKYNEAVSGYEALERDLTGQISALSLSAVAKMSADETNFVDENRRPLSGRDIIGFFEDLLNKAKAEKALIKVFIEYKKLEQEFNDPANQSDPQKMRALINRLD
ncbi:MAG: hypothetical protein HQL27_05490, partial [Candidatus Omnitrophica bacterium]|nr:hypothetical protein [Candidatus Omnitrophota bacterium]